MRQASGPPFTKVYGVGKKEVICCNSWQGVGWGAMVVESFALDAMSTSKTWVWLAELTDVFGGEANYSWVRRVEFSAPAGASQRVVVAAGKAALGLTGVRCETVDCGDWYQLRPVGSQTVAFLRSC